MKHFWLLKMLLGLVVWGCSMAEESIYDFKASVDGKEVSLDIYPQSGAKVLLIVNVNSVCNAAQEQFRLLNALHDKYHTQGLVILGFPNNQFGREEPEESHRVYGKELHFPVMDPVVINGPDAHPLFAYLKSVTGGLAIRWNFHKFLVYARDGEPWYRLDEEYPAKLIETHIERMLEAKEAPTPAHRETRRQERAEKEQGAAEALAAAKAAMAEAAEMEEEPDDEEIIEL